MANNSCILGCITADSSNNVVAWYQGVTLYSTTITAGDYFPASATGSENLASTIQTAMNAAGGYTFTVSFSNTTGLFSISTTGGSFTLLATWTNSILGSCGYIEDNTPNISGSTYAATAEKSPDGTWFPRSTDSNEEIQSDSKWITAKKGKSVQGTIGKQYTRTWGSTRRRIISFSPIVGADGFAYPLYDIDRAADCYREHWGIGKRVRVFTNTRTVTTAVDNDDIFDGVVMGGDFSPQYEGGENKDWWTITLEFMKYVS